MDDEQAVGVKLSKMFGCKSLTLRSATVASALRERFMSQVVGAFFVLIGIFLVSCSWLQAPATPKGFAILLSDNSPAFIGVQRAINKHYPQGIKTYRLGGGESDAEILKKIQHSDKPILVAVGLPAAKLARSLANKKVIFCQVFNYEDTDLIAPHMKGVAATPPVSEQFRVWKTLAPQLKKVGVITGKNLRSFIDEASAAARENHIDLIHVEVKSDKETLYAYKQLAPKIQGLWLVPDNRVLSRDTIRDMMAYSVKEGKQVSVFSHGLLGMGGLLSAESSYADIAEQVLLRVEQAGRAKEIPGDPITALTQANIRINPVMAGRLNLPLPKSLRGMVHAP